jgi:uncharacterized alkaline shock family protein YloU
MSVRPLVLAGPLGRIEISGDALEAVAIGAVRTVAGAGLARGRRVVEIETEDGTAEARVVITAEAGAALPDVGEHVQRAVAAALAATTGLEVRVDVSVVGLTT